MAAKDRTTLKTSFKTNAIPTAKDFSDLIDSMLNKRDDHFFGVWQPGAKYCKGDVVLFEKSLFMLVNTDGEQCTDEPKVQASPCDDGQSNQCICSKDPPRDGGNWCMLRLDVEDDDWKLVFPAGSGTPNIMYAKVDGIRVGIGAKDPDARFEVSDDGITGQLLLEPGWQNDDGSAQPPSFEIRNLVQQPGTFLKSTLTGEALWTTNAPLGYLFKIQQPAASPQQQQQQKRGGGYPSGTGGGSFPPHEDLLLMLVGSKNNRPRVGISTDEPDASLDVKWEGKGQVLLQPGEKPDPEILLLNLDEKCDKNYLALSVGEAFASLTAGANGGFRFSKGEALAAFSQSQDAKKLLVSFDGNGKVGIGVENPVAHLHVRNFDGGPGEARISLNQTHPALALIKFKPDKANYLTLGPDNDQANFVTDSQEGFLFRKGKRCGQGNSEEKVSDGQQLVRIQAPAKQNDPGEYDLLRLTPTLDVKGLARNYGQYIVADSNVCEETGEIGDNVLDLLSELTPIRFRWQEGTPIGDIGEQFGLRADDVEENFSQVVMNTNDRLKAIAYQNLVPVLIKAVQVLTERIEVLEGKRKSR